MGWRAALVVTVAASLCVEAEAPPIRTYTAADGLASNQAIRIFADSRGFLWFGTPEGLSRFDGFRFVNFAVGQGLTPPVVETIIETRSGDYLVGTSRGLCRFRPGSGGKLTTYLPGRDPLQNSITALLQDSSGRIWCGTSNGLFELTAGFQFRPQPLPIEPSWDRVFVGDILEGRGGQLWVATATGLDVVGANGGVQHIGQAEGLPSMWVNALLRDRGGRIWAATRGGLALMRDQPANGHAEVDRVFIDTAGSRNVGALTEGVDGTLWLGTSDGISRLHAGGIPAAFDHLTRANGLIDRQIVALSLDRTGNMWAGTEGAGVMRIARGGFTTFNEQDGLASDRVWSVLGDRAGSFLAVTVPAGDTGMGTINVFDGVRFHPVVPGVFGQFHNWGADQVLLQTRSGEWWAATMHGLCRFRAGSVASLAGRQPVCYAPDIQVFKIFEDTKGGIWASGQSLLGNRLMRWDPAAQTLAYLAPDPVARLVSAFAEDRRGNVWMGVWEGSELYRYDGTRITRFRQSDGVPNGTVFALRTDHLGRIWIGSSVGLAVIGDPAGAQFAIRHYDTGNGLASNRIECLVEDLEGRIYAGTAKGVDRLDPPSGNVKHYTTADGLAHGETTSAFRDGSGNLWFATKQGLSRLTPAADLAPAVPSVRITDLRVGRDRYPLSQVGETSISRIRLQPSLNQLQVQFVGFNNEPEERLRYEYMLEGEGSGWHGPDRDHEANYPGLPPGTYRMVLKAVNSEGRESAVPAQIDFVVLPPFYRRWWFEVLLLGCLAGLTWAAHSYRLAQAVNLERVRTAIATDLHDDIGASLSQIAILSEVARMDGKLGRPQPNERLDRVVVLARELVDSMSDIVWSIRSEPEGVDSLTRRMREFAGDLLESQNIAFELLTSHEDARLKLSLQARRNLFLIFKECIHNAARHSGCSQVNALFQVAKHEVLLRVSDNGRGLSPDGGSSHGQGGNGFPNLKRRAGDLGGDIEWTATAGGGCTVETRAPMRRGILRKPGL